jgi:hypothetical protein
MTKELSTEYIMKVVQSFLDSVLQSDERDRALRSEPAAEEERDEELEALDLALSNVEEGIALSDYAWGQDIIDGVIEAYKIDIERGTDLYRLLSREVLKATAKAIQVQINRWNGKYDGDPLIIKTDSTSNSATEVFKDKIGPPGRPDADWGVIKTELLRIESDNKLPEIRRGWRTKVSQTLRDWYVNEHDGKGFKEPYISTHETIMNQKLIKAELNRIEDNHNAQTR